MDTENVPPKTPSFMTESEYNRLKKNIETAFEVSVGVARKRKDDDLVVLKRFYKMIKLPALNKKGT